MQVTRPGVLELVERPSTAPGIGQVLIAVEACGICGADVGDIEGADPALQPPRVPGLSPSTCLASGCRSRLRQLTAGRKSHPISTHLPNASAPTHRSI
uniref:alcohol dehydrogenase catalytic domain-containing protein n=1 Tax=Pseudomonas sp. TH21 TaxID=2796387 RepID=UPI001F5B9D34|nr:alcohol dehydrogenase catalytic domain-containing protein [Pseudomonas sp. TH21]